MQTIELINTVKWIHSQFSPDLHEYFFAGRLLADLHRLAREKERGPGGDAVLRMLAVSHELARVCSSVRGHPQAVEILSAFELTLLLDDEFPVRLAAQCLGITAGERPPEMDDVRSLMDQWRLLSSFVPPLQTLTTPSELTAQKDFDDILTLETRFDEASAPSLETIAGILGHVKTLYSAVATTGQKEHVPSLTLLYAASGSSVRFDFTGLGEVIKELKSLLVEAWSLIRHRKADDVKSNLQAVLGGGIGH